MTRVCLFVCVVGPGYDSTFPVFVRSRASHAAGRDSPLAKGRVGWPQFVQVPVAFQPRAGCVFYGTKHRVEHYLRLHTPESSCAGGYFKSMDHLMMTMDIFMVGDSAWYSSSTVTRGSLLDIIIIIIFI